MVNLISECLCGGRDFQFYKIHGIPVRICKACQVVHQYVEMTEDQLLDWYRTKYDGEYQSSIGCVPYEARYSNDVEIARSRLAKYNPKGKVLDVGCGNSAFVNVCNQAGVDATGTTLAQPNGTFEFPEKIYSGRLRDINFPTNSFDVICYHDVMEHVVDLNREFQEISRILKPGGRLIVDFPNFWKKEGEHHWRPIQHLWFLESSQLEDLLRKYDFHIQGYENPIENVPSKFLIETVNQKREAPRVLLLPGMGDIYWVAAKISSWARKVHPRVKVWNFDKRPRSADYVQRISFFEGWGYYDAPNSTPEFNEGYMRVGRTWFPGLHGFDFFISYNGILRNGLSLETVDPYLPVDWKLPLFQSNTEKAFGKTYRDEYGRYIVACFSDMGMFRNWVANWNVGNVVQVLREISRELQTRVVLTGSSWDQPFNERLAALDSSLVNLTGKTNLDQFFGLVRNAYGCFGWCGGNTIQAAGLGVPTGIVWNGYFTNESFYRHSVDPKARYMPIIQGRDSLQRSVTKFVGLFK